MKFSQATKGIYGISDNDKARHGISRNFLRNKRHLINSTSRADPSTISSKARVWKTPAAAMKIAVSLFLVASLLLVSDAADSKDNPADELVAAINSNRTAHKSSSLVDNPGLGCIALQYVKAYQGQCDEVGKDKKPPDAEFAETFAPNCGVQVSTLAPITGRFLGCQSRYVGPSEAFSDILIQSKRSLDILYSKNHTQVGAGVSGSDGGAPYFWCVLLSGGAPNSTFVLQDGAAKIQRPGCFSGTNDDCSGADGSNRHLPWTTAAGILIGMAFAVGL